MTSYDSWKVGISDPNSPLNRHDLPNYICEACGWTGDVPAYEYEDEDTEKEYPVAYCPDCLTDFA